MKCEAPATVTTRGEAQTIELGERIGRALRAGDIVLLSGELGAGKTRLVKGIASGLGLDSSDVSSPTYVVMNEYAGEGVTLVHADAHRLSEEDDLDTIGWDRAQEGEAIIVVEWAERLGERTPAGALLVTIEHAGDEERRIVVSGEAARWGGLLESIEPASKCPICGDGTRESRSTFPFCSGRCKLVDLGKWLGGQYVVSRRLEPDDLDEQP